MPFYTLIILFSAVAMLGGFFAGRRAFSRTLALDEAMLASIGEGFVAVDQRGAIIKINEAAERMLRVSATDAMGKLLSDVLRIEDEKGMVVPVAERPVARALFLGRTIVEERYSIVRGDKTKFIASLIASPMRDGNRVLGVVQVLRDITEQKRIDRTKTEFVSLASHQLRTPPSIINWYVEMLLSGEIGSVTEKQKKYLEEIHHGNQRMIEIVTALLNVSRLDLGSFLIEPRPIDICHLADSVVGELRPKVDDTIKFRQTYEENLPLINADPALLQIIFYNLLSNAIKYTPQRGAITLEIKKAEDRIVISVRDTGIGIPKSAQEKIFTKLFRADNARDIDPDGTGLGLYMVKSIVSEAGGTISFESEEGKGSTFLVSFPMSGMKHHDGEKQLDAVSRSLL